MKKLLLLMLMAPTLAGAQSVADPAAAPHMVRAAGMPLDDGTIPPGMLTVRIVEGAFTRDVAGVQVDVEVAGGKVESAVTGADGRAQFAHMPIGAQVRASATVAGEPLVSQAFQIPSHSGVRLLLVTGAGASPDGAPAAPAAIAATAAAPSTAPIPLATPASGDATDIAVIRAILATATFSAFAFLTIGRWRARRRQRAD